VDLRIDKSTAEARRMQLAPVEAYAKAVGRYHLIFGIWPVVALCDDARFAFLYPQVLHPNDRSTVLWVVRATTHAVTLVLWLAALRHFWKQKRISLPLEAAMISFWTVMFFFHRIFGTPKDTISYAIAEVLLYVLVVLPLVELGVHRNSPVFSQDYADLVSRTQHIRVKAKLPVRLKIGMAILFVIYVILAAVSQA
jgi:hypothetical protein